MLSYQATLICNLLQGKGNSAQDVWNIYWRVLEASHKGWRCASKQEEFWVGNHKWSLAFPNCPTKRPDPPLSPQPRTHYSGNIDLQPGLHCEKSSLPLPLLKYRCLISARTGQGYYLHLFCGLKIRLFTYLSAHLTQNKNKEDREVRISKSPCWFLQDSWGCRVCFYFFLKKFKSDFLYIPSCKNTTREPRLIKRNQCIVTLSGQEALCLALKVVGLK